MNAIPSAVRSHGAALVAMVPQPRSSRSRTVGFSLPRAFGDRGLRDSVLGTRTQRVIREASCPCW